MKYLNTWKSQLVKTAVTLKSVSKIVQFETADDLNILCSTNFFTFDLRFPSQIKIRCYIFKNFGRCIVSIYESYFCKSCWAFECDKTFERSWVSKILDADLTGFSLSKFLKIFHEHNKDNLLDFAIAFAHP